VGAASRRKYTVQIVFLRHEASFMRTTYDTIQPYTTKDGSEIRELMHPSLHGNRNLSLAEATVAPGAQTVLHRHNRTEEVYYITHGAGLMTLGAEKFVVAAGDTICIVPGTPHCIRNTGDAALKILCACAPAYAHDDTELLDAPLEG
jgi:mannose-6-phosphate isomerase-like protein (cupin superfamily)